MSSQPETLRLADAIEQIPSLVKVTNEEAAKELRRLHEVNQELAEALKELMYARTDKAESMAEAALAKLEESHD